MSTTDQTDHLHAIEEAVFDALAVVDALAALMWSSDEEMAADDVRRAGRALTRSAREIETAVRELLVAVRKGED